MIQIAPRLHVILARDALTGVVFRRGPSKQVALFGWDRKADTFTLGQWLKGRIYPMRSDLSPDGKHLIYFAMNSRWHEETGGSWTAVSRAPFLTALHLYGWGHCWNGGGVFVDNHSYWLNAGPMSIGPSHRIASPFFRRYYPPNGFAVHHGEDPELYLPRLLRDGWIMGTHTIENGDDLVRLTRGVRQGWTLEKLFRSDTGKGPNRECYWETHVLYGPDTVIDGSSWIWAEVDRHSVVFARNGAIWRMPIHAKIAGAPKLLMDFSGMTFAARKAPYEGVQHV